MRKSFVTVVLSLIAFCANAQIRLVDAGDGTPVPAASVFVDGGKCAGVSGEDGSLPLPADYKGRVAVHHINYVGKEFVVDTVAGSTVRLTPYTYTIPEVTARYERPDYMVISAYVRNYIIVDSVPSSFRHGSFDFYVPMRKGRVRRKVRFLQILRADGVTEDDVLGNYCSQDWAKLKKHTLLDRFRNKGFLNDSSLSGIVDRGWKGVVWGMRNDTVAKTLTVYADSAFMEGNGFNVNLFGLKMRFNGMKFGETYDVSVGMPTLANLLCKYDYLDLSLKLPGKKNKFRRGEEFGEFFVTGIRYATKDEMKAAIKDKTPEPATVPQGVPPLGTPLADAVNKMK